MTLPYKDQNSDKKEQVGQMFDQIAYRYDFLNHFLSLGIDKFWRRKLRKKAAEYHPEYILDMATGTGDLAIELYKLNPKEILGIDISTKMLQIAQQKAQKKNLDIIFTQADGESTGFNDQSFDLVSIAFGIRNYQNPADGIREAKRILKKNGVLMILEFSKPRIFPVKQIYLFYFLNLLPLFGKLFSKDKNAYNYLPESVMNFPDGQDFISILKECGFVNNYEFRFSFGVTTLYISEMN